MMENDGVYHECYCQKGKNITYLLGKSKTASPDKFVCPKLFLAQKEQVLCSLPAIEGAARKIPICGVYETLRVGKKSPKKFIPKHSPFARHGYLSILESGGIDPL